MAFYAPAACVILLQVENIGLLTIRKMTYSLLPWFIFVLSFIKYY